MSLQVEELRFRYGGGEPVLDGVSFTARRGELLGLLGPNGTGKTTLLRCVQRVLTPCEGRVLLDGRDLWEMGLRQRARLVAYVPQGVHGALPVSVADFVLSGRTPFAAGGRLSQNDREIAFTVLERLGLKEFAFRQMGALSGGERQRVLLARALAQTPQVLLLDEPTASLDLRNQLRILELVEELARRERLAVVLAIHDLNLAAACCRSLVLLGEGRVQATGTPEDILTPENLHSAYGVETEVVQARGQTFVHLLKAPVNVKNEL